MMTLASMPSDIEQAIYATVRYFNVLNCPVTATQIWHSLVVDTSQQRWGGHEHWHLRHIQETLKYSAWLKSRVGMKWGYVFLQGHEHLVRERLTRHRTSQQKWNIAFKAAKYLALVPFVRGLAGSGSLAADNTKPDSDLDFFVITAPRRIWTARLLLLAVASVLGRRRKHWYKRAPDMLCLNHYVSQQHLALPTDIHNVYTAVLYTLLVPVYGAQVVRDFQEKNASWISRYIMSYEAVVAPHRYTVRAHALAVFLKRFVESLLLEPIGDGLEKLAEKFQRRLISIHSTGQAGRVALSSVELAFHPDTKVPALLAQYERDPQQRSLL